MVSYAESFRAIRRAVAPAGRAWLALTDRERQALALILSLGLLGLTVKFLHSLGKTRNEESAVVEPGADTLRGTKKAVLPEARRVEE